MKKKLFLITTIPISLNFFRGQISSLNSIFEVTLISTPDAELDEIATIEGTKKKGIIIKREISFISDIISLLKLIYYFRIHKPHIVHCNTPKASLLGLMAARIVNVKNRIYYIHGLRYEGSTGLKRMLLIYMEKIACWCATDIIAVSNGVKKSVNDILTKKKISVIHNGSANGMFIKEFSQTSYKDDVILKELNLTKKDFIFTFVGRLVSDKGINELIEAFAILHKDYDNAKLLLIGSYEHHLDPLLDNTQKIIKNNNNILELGFQKDVKKYLTISNILVSPSYREGFGLVLLEANLMGKPVIASKITGYSEIITEGYNGFFIKKKISL